MSTAAAAPPAPSAVPARAALRLPPLWLCWLLVAAALLIGNWGEIAAGQLQEADDYMRMLQVRDWVDGQGWFDTRQYRLDPPNGAAMHWTRLVDLPLAAALAVLRLFLAAPLAEHLTMALVPLLHLLATMYLARAVVARVSTDPLALFAAGLLPLLFPLVLSNLMPGRVDHHAWQGFAALAMAWAMLRNSWRSALAAGLIAAALLMISLEGIVPAALFGALFAWRYWRFGQRQHEAFLLGLGAGLPALFVILRPVGEIGQALCDLPSWPHFLAFGGSAVVAATSRLLPGQDRPSGRLLSLLPIALVAAPALFIPLGWCVVSPLQLDPYMERFWFANMAESAPIFRQSASIAAMTLWTLAIAVVGSICAWHWTADRAARDSWMLLGAAALAAGLYSLLLMRAGLTAQLLTLPFAALLIGRLLPAARALPSAAARTLATLGVLGLATPVLAGALTKGLDRPVPMFMQQPQAGLDLSRCPIERLSVLPKSTVFTTLDRAPEILARTQHTAVMSGYHRNLARMRQMVQTFEGPLAQSQQGIRATGARYLAVCLTSSDLWLAASSGQDSLAGRIVRHQPLPRWLKPVAGFTSGSLLVFAVQP